MTLLDANLVRRGRQQLQLSVRQLAKDLGVSMPVIQRIEDRTNHKDLPLQLVAQLADTLAVPARHFLPTTNLTRQRTLERMLRR